MVDDKREALFCEGLMMDFSNQTKFNRDTRRSTVTSIRLTFVAMHMHDEKSVGWS